MEQTLKQKVNTHWARMIEWAEKQNPNKEASQVTMWNAIKEHWGGGYCDYCHYSNCKVAKDRIKDACIICPIFLKFRIKCGVAGYTSVNSSQTWGEWVKSAIEFKKNILDKV